MRSRRIYWFGIRAVKDMKSLEWRRTMGPRGCWDRTVGERCPNKWGLNGDVRDGEETGMGSGEESSRPGGRKLWGGGKLSSWSWVRASLNGFSRNGVIVRLLVNSYRQPSWILSENCWHWLCKNLCCSLLSKITQNAGKVWWYHLHFHIVRWNFILWWKHLYLGQSTCWVFWSGWL